MEYLSQGSVGLEDPRISACEFIDEMLWVGSRSGWIAVFELRAHSFSLIHKWRVCGNVIYSLVFDASMGLVWVGSIDPVKSVTVWYKDSFNFCADLSPLV